MPNGKPNILVIWGDNTGLWDAGIHTHALQGKNPNIDRLAKEGCLFTDHYGQSSEAAGRAAFMMSQMPVRIGMTATGDDGSVCDTQKKDPTLAEVLKSAGYATGEFGESDLEQTLDWLDRHKDSPFFCWFESKRNHDADVGALLAWLDEYGLTDDTIVLCSTGSGHASEDTNWEGGVRVPLLVRWPGKVPEGTSCSGLQAHEDLYVTLAAAAGLTDLKQQLLGGARLGGSALTYRVHLDGFNQLDMWTGKSRKSARNAYFYYDETELTAVRVGNWKMRIGVKKTADDRQNARSRLPAPYIFNLRVDPMEKLDPDSGEWDAIGRKFFASNLWAPTAATPCIAEHLRSLRAYPPRQAAMLESTSNN